jgi:hypothetical protein
MQHSDVAWCAVSSDCAVQNLPVGPCADAWACSENACAYECGPLAAEGDQAD